MARSQLLRPRRRRSSVSPKSSSGGGVRTSSLLAALSTLSALVRPVHSDIGEFYHLDRNPQLRWSSDLSTLLQLDAFGFGNEVQLSPDGDMLYLTTLRGALLSRQVNETNYRGQPGSWNRYLTPDRDNGWSTKCHTGIGFSLPDINNPYFVIGIEDEPPVLTSGNSDERIPTSRIVAFNHPFKQNDEPRWISSPLEGVISGTPVVSSDGRFVFFNRNLNSTRLGVFTVLQSGNKQVRELTSLSTAAYAPGPYAPLGVARNPLEGNYNGGESNRNDLLVWGHYHIRNNAEDTTWERGYVQAFQFRTAFDGNDASREQIVTLQDVPWSTFHGPLFTSTGMEMYMGTSKSEARGWSSVDDRYNNRPTWKTEDLLRDETRALKSFPGWGGPALSPDEETLYTTSTTTAVYALNAEDGDVKWSDGEMPSIVKCRPVVAPDGRRVYFLGSDGTVISKRTSDGRNQWRFQPKEGVTAGEAEMTVSPDGTTLYYAGNSGTTGRYAYALAVGELETAEPTLAPTLAPTPSPTSSPTSSPTQVPSTLEPTATPTTEPTSAPTPSEPTTSAPTTSPTSSPTDVPSPSPTIAPTTLSPTTAIPTSAPTDKPTPFPTNGVNIPATADSSAAVAAGRGLRGAVGMGAAALVMACLAAMIA